MSNLPQPPSVVAPRFDDWLFRFWKESSVPATSVVVNPSNINHALLQNTNSTSLYHLTQTQYAQLTSGGVTTLHSHGISSSDFGSTSTIQWSTGTPISATVITSGLNHAQLSNLDSSVYSHVSALERTDLLGATYLVLNHNPTSLTSERVLSVGTGLTYTDGGAGGSYTINQYAFVGDSGSGGYIGAVPAPAIGDGSGTYRSYLCADGLWRNPGTAGDVNHNNMTGIEGGIATGVFETSAFEPTAFQFGVTEYFHVTEDSFNNLAREASVLTTAIDATLDDTSATCVVTASAKTITLPPAIAARIGKVWTVIQNCTGYVDVEPDVTDGIVLPGGSDTIRLDQIGSSVSLKCISSTEWVIV